MQHLERDLHLVSPLFSPALSLEACDLQAAASVHTAGFAMELRAGQERLAALAAQLEGAAPEAGGRAPLANVVAGLDEVRVLHGADLPAAWLLIAHGAVVFLVALPVYL